jgi:L-ascorbate metabolism protein UlaG (beta-lactamase superfamily)
VLGVTWLGHSTTVIDLAGKRLITDPLLYKHAPPLRRRWPRPDRTAWHGADAALVSHLHHDHAELRSLRLLGHVPILTSRRNADWFARKGFSSAHALDDEWHDLGDGVEIRLVPAVHGARPMPHRPNDANGHLIRAADGHSVWFAGDTEIYEGMAHLEDWVGRRLTAALIPIAGWGPKLSEGHLDPEEAAAACAMVDAEYVVPVHWGTLHVPWGRHLPRGWMDRPLAAFEEALARKAPRSRLVPLRPGERCMLPLPDEGGVSTAG